MMLIQISQRLRLPKPLVPGIFLVLVTGFLAVQVKAARIHTSVELTAKYLREGTETILIRGDPQGLSGGRRPRGCRSGSRRARWGS